MDNTPKKIDIEIANSVPYIPAEKKRYNYTMIHGIFALLAFVMGTLWYRWVFSYRGEGLFRGNEALSVTMFTLAFCAFTMSYFRLRKARFCKDSFVFLAAMLVFSLRFTLYPSDTWSFVSVLAQLVLHVTALLFVYSVGAPDCMDKIVGSTAKAFFVAPYASFYRIFTALSVFFKRRKKELSEEDTAKKDKLFYEICFVVLGLCIAVPVVSCVFALLCSDGFFYGFLESIFNFLGDLRFDIRFTDYINIITVLVSMFIFGAVFSSDKKRDDPKCTPTDFRVVPRTIGKTVLAVLLVVYALFTVAQIDGFSHMAMGILPANTTYADFARSGFFELCIVACINGAALYYFEILSEREPAKSKIGIIRLLVVCFTFFLIITAALKMTMYICAYGFTPKRFYTLLFMLLLLVLFVMVVFKLRDSNFKLSRYSVYVTLVWLAVLFLVDFEGISFMLNTEYFSLNV